MTSSLDPIWDIDNIQRLSMASLLDFFNRFSLGTMAVDRQGRIAWIHDKYAEFLGLNSPAEALGRQVEEIIPNSRMREVVQSGKPIMLDIISIRGHSLVITRLPLRDESDRVFGAFAFALYDDLDQLRPLVSRFSELQAALESTRKELAQLRRGRGTRYSISSFIGASAAALELKTRARRAAQLDSPVLLLGETGTGKEMLAQGIHAASARASKPFIGVNIAAIPETLLEAEFFGVAPGAYTGADRKGRDGKFKAADGGTLFLDEIGDMPMQIQAKLLRALQEREIEPLGANKVLKINVRIIAATSRNLTELISAGQFRSDLYYRLNVLPIALPPLRERVADIDALCEHLLEQIAAQSGMAQRELSVAARDLLAHYDWPGNVRELGNILEQACMLSDAHVLDASNFLPILPIAKPSFKDIAAERRNGLRRSVASSQPRLDKVISETEKNLIEAALRDSRGNKSLAARTLGISRGKLYQKIEQFDILFNK
ncbi:sigma-54 interaction domain-containing protein [Noviherbaspirillum sedimenti]|uniref:AAA family ATPase n=1 Tax=Noviherbaspirillum sedimenti TaxID=2320865 RepID=A0A3A3FWY3_9BURK|nr:sigma 54-interacting transcriptional regulator [Noviherbaspirillum sedimenti]RJG00723.1 AAA family ATPase [Noviherbaspirillum sedimenti]